MNPFRLEYLSTGLLIGSSALAVMTACHLQRHTSVQASRLEKQTRQGDQLKDLLTRHDVLITNRRKEYDQMAKQTKSIKHRIEKKRIDVDLMKSLVQQYPQVSDDREDTLRLCQRIQQFLSDSSSSSQPNKNNPQRPTRTSSAGHLRVAEIIDFFEQK